MSSIHLAILGATGSIGTQTLDIVRAHPEKCTLTAISAHKNWKLLAQQVHEFKPKYAILTDPAGRADFQAAISGTGTKIIAPDEIPDILQLPELDIVLNAMVGFAGFSSTYAALKAGKKVALANKESLVVGGPVLAEWCGVTQHQLLPVDSEHSAILQCLVGESEKEIEKLIITASGGPFRDKPLSELAKVTVADALNHPNWEMGAKITIDSATMMNKGLEVIEAKWLFDIPIEKIEAVIHPQSIIHSMVTFCDGSTKAQMGYPDMKVPIQYALSFPERWNLDTPRMDWSKPMECTFQPVDYDRFPCFRLAMEALQEGAHAPAILNAANEVAVQRFLDREIGYISISKIVEQTLSKVTNASRVSVSSLFDTDAESRKVAHSLNI